ncbi:MAG TPA: histidine kinase [Pedococcus sp.]|nr:histidine kinase [Pedococcus sp.]
MLLTNPHPLPRTVWGEAWRILLAALFSGLLFVAMASGPAHDGPPGWLTALDVLLGVLSLVLLPLRRRYPLPVAFLLACFGFVSICSAGAALIALISLCTHRRWVPVAVTAVPSILAGLSYEQIRPTGNGSTWDTVTNIVIGVLVYAVCVAIGYYLGARRALLASWRERAETAEREQSSRVAEARANERARIAREMHDVLAHRISLVAMHSGALAYREDLDREEVTQAATVIRDNAHLALTELRDVLGVLRLTDAEASPTDPPERPQPTLADLDELLADARAAGCAIDARVDLDAAHGIPDSLSRNAFRIVQEVVTNARKHAPAERLALEVRAAPGDGVHITARNAIPSGGDGPALPRSGMGLAGLTERAVLSGGSLTFGVDRRGDFVVTARLPWDG